MTTRRRKGNESDPWTYRGNNLKHLDFPLGGIGTGNILLQGDGCLRGWDIQNQFHSPQHRPLHNLPPLNASSSDGSGDANYWAISAVYDDDDDEEENTKGGSGDAQEQEQNVPRPAFLLRSANHYGIRHESSNNSTTASSDSATKDESYSKPCVRPPDVPEISVRARYPIAQISYTTPPSFPLSNIQLEAMTPLVPTDSKASGYPMVVVCVSFTNSHPTKTVSVDVMQSAMNFIGWDGGKSRDMEFQQEEEEGKRTLRNNETNGINSEATDGLPPCIWGGNINNPFVYSTAPPPPTPPNDTADLREEGALGGSISHSCMGLFLHTKNELKEDLTRKGSIAISAICRNNSKMNATAEPHPTPTVQIIKAVTSETELFSRFQNRDFEDINPDQPSPPSPKGSTYAGAVVQSFSKIPPRATAKATFCLSWHFPYRPCTAPRANLPPDFYGNLYATWYSDAKDVAVKFCDSFPKSNWTKQSSTLATASKKPKNLLEITRSFVEALYGSTIPWEVLESAAGRLAIPRSPTLFRTEAGIVLGYAGNDQGPLNATNGYGYTTLLERIFPSLARDMLTSSLVRNFDPASGGCLLSYGQGGFAIDGALASVIKVYLVVQQSDPGLQFLGTVWPNVKRQMTMILDNKQQLDARDGVITGPQQTTYGGPMNGANTLVGTYLVTALKATQAMANLMGDVNFGKKCSKQIDLSSQGYETHCWREDFGYYVADVDSSNCQNSYGTGCILDQLVGTSLSRACGFGSVLDSSREARARRSVLRNNVVTNPPFCDEDGLLGPGDSGLRVCTYPHGKLGDGIPSSDKVASGLVYPLVAGLIGDGNWEDAIQVCSFVRSRQSGVHTSPWNEPESGGLYSSRSMSGWNLLDQACGFTYDSTKASIGFAPRIHAESFKCFCTFSAGFGEFRQETTTCDGTNDSKFSAGTASFRVLYGSTELQSICLNTSAHVVEASLDGQAVKASIDANGVVTFDAKLAIGEDSTLALTLSSPCCNKTIPTPFAERVEKPSAPEIARKAGRRNWIRRMMIHCVCISVLYWWVFRLPAFHEAGKLRSHR